MCVYICACSVTQLCLTLCDPMDCSPPGSPVHGIFQARILEWVSVSFSRGSSRDQTHISCIGRRILDYSATWKALLDISVQMHRTSHVVLVVKNPPANAGDIRDEGLTHGLGRSPGGEHGNPLQYSCLENPMDRGAWRASVFQSWTQLKQLIMHIYIHTFLSNHVANSKNYSNS